MISTKGHFWKILVFLIMILSFNNAYTQERGIKIIAEDATTKEWEEISLYNQTHAVIIGIDNYPKLSANQQLSYAVSDAKAVENILSSKFIFNKIYTLYNEQATKNNIEDILLNKLADISKEDAVFVFFAGHGGQESTEWGEIGYIVPYNGDFTDMRNVISMTAIKEDISKRIKAKHVFFVMDACYSGLLIDKRGNTIKESNRDINYLRQITKESVRQVLTAGDADQQVLDGGPDGHSVFTGRFLEILNEAEDFITAEEISASIKETVFSDANARGHVQTPQSGTLFGMGDFIFMPSMTKKLGSIGDQISILELELQKLDAAEITAEELKSDSEKRELERQRKATEAQLEAARLEEQRLEAEKEQKAKQEEERTQRLAEQKRLQEEEDLRLKALTEEITEKRKEYKSSMITSLDQALVELQSLDSQIESLKTTFIEELKKRVNDIARAHSDRYSYTNLVKDEFETEAQYQARVKEQTEELKSTNQEEFTLATQEIKTAFDEQVAPLIEQIEDISSTNYTVYGHDALKIKLEVYDAETNCFTITVASNNIEREIHPYGKYVDKLNPNQFIVCGKLQMPIAEAKRFKQDYLNGFITAELSVRPLGHSLSQITSAMIIDESNDSRYDLFKSRFLYMGNQLIYDTENKLTWLTSYPKKLSWAGADKYANNYDFKGTAGWQLCSYQALKSLCESSELVNFRFSDIFHTNSLYENSTKHVQFEPKNNSNIYVLEDTDHRYFILTNTGNNVVQEIDIYQPRFFQLDNNLIFDCNKKIIWHKTRITDTKYTFLEADKYIKEYSYGDIEGWRLPTYSEITSLWDLSIPGINGIFRLSGIFYTSSFYKNSTKHVQFEPENNRGSYVHEDTDKRYIIGVM
ncbi:MAG: caspase family protein [Candidatus Cloacimonetes bacterium]|nr:caspase family protein [Candidatus Cloacimonadota bacterium]